MKLFSLFEKDILIGTKTFNVFILLYPAFLPLDLAAHNIHMQVEIFLRTRKNQDESEILSVRSLALTHFTLTD